MSSSRRSFLRGRFRPDPDMPRPPWAIPVGAFEDQCTRCGDCLKACPPAILVAAAGGYPVVDFSRGECSFCADCAVACKAGALVRPDAAAAPWQLKAEIGEDCLARRGVECRVCGEACGAAAIRFRPILGSVAQPLFDAGRCTGCGGCLALCPTGAIAMKNDAEMHV